jgi:hypothetical protein
MNWEVVGAIAQVLGSVAVFITLVYLSIQTRHARDATQRSISQARAEAIRQAYAWASEPRMVGIAVKANSALGRGPSPFMAMLMNEAGLTAEEAGTQYYFELSGWNSRLQAIAAKDAMNSIERHWLDSNLMVVYGGDRGITRMFYEMMKPNAHPDVVRYIEEVLARQTTQRAPIDSHHLGTT